MIAQRDLSCQGRTSRVPAHEAAEERFTSKPAIQFMLRETRGWEHFKVASPERLKSMFTPEPQEALNEPVVEGEPAGPFDEKGIINRRHHGS